MVMGKQRRKGRRKWVRRCTAVKEMEEAKGKELDSWKENGVFEEVKREEMKSNNNMVDTRWIINKKIKNNEEIWKARLVARGFKEKEAGIEKEAPTCSSEGLKMVLSIILRRGWTIRTLDIKTAYLQGRSIRREVYIKPPKEAHTGN